MRAFAKHDMRAILREAGKSKHPNKGIGGRTRSHEKSVALGLVGGGVIHVKESLFKKIKLIFVNTFQLIMFFTKMLTSLRQKKRVRP